MKVNRKQLVNALCDVLDGVYYAHEIRDNTGLSLKRCKKIIEIRDAIKKEWLIR
jgi:hypothetical protein